MEPLDLSRRHEFGAFYDPKNYYDCRMETSPRDTQCEIHALRRNEPEPVWPNPDAPPIKWPEAPESVYRSGMSSKEYFEALCEAEAGKFIYRTVENIEGVYQVRPRHTATDVELQDIYVLENPYHYTLGEADSRGAAYLGPDSKNGGNKYAFWETSLYEPESRWGSMKRFLHPSMGERPSADARYIRYHGYQGGNLRETIKSYATSLRSRYGYTWRGIDRENDRELGIAGGELAIVDLDTNEILGLWRGFSRTSLKKNKAWWLGAAPEGVLISVCEPVSDFTRLM